MLAVGTWTERHVIERCWLPASAVILQERPVAGVVVLVRGEQIEHGAGELRLTGGCARAECLTGLDEILVVHRGCAKVRVEQPGEAV